jgi:ADP-ribose pyrophosphatase
MERPKVISSARAFEGRVFDVRIDELQYAGDGSHRIDVVEHGPSFAIVATPEPQSLILVRQYRHAAGEVLWELPAGKAESGEDPARGAERELREETGYRAARIRRLAALWVTPGFCDETLHLFHAEGLTPGEQALDDDERIDVRTFDVDAAWRLVARQDITDMKTVLALLWMQSNRGEIGDGFGR